ncbi:phage fiber-tail adaptor protein [Streptomyces hydrogenans]
MSHDASTVTVWRSGGVLGTTYEVACHITTSQERTEERTIGIRVTDR